MATKQQERAFKELFPSFEDFREWLLTEFTPAELYEDADDALHEWAEENNYLNTEDEDAVMAWADENGYIAEDDDEKLHDWAVDNGYIQEEDCPECDREHTDD